MKIPLKFPPVMAAFRKPLTIETYRGAYVLDSWQEEFVEQREIQAIVLQPTQEEIKLYADGNSSEGVISITTTEALNFSDVLDGNAVPLQDYALYKGYRFKIKSSLFMHGNTDVRIYWAVRYYV